VFAIHAGCADVQTSRVYVRVVIDRFKAVRYLEEDFTTVSQCSGRDQWTTINDKTASEDEGYVSKN